VHNLAAHPLRRRQVGHIGAMRPLLIAIAAAQCGVFSRAQALSIGYTEKQIRHLLAVRTWVRCHAGVYCVAGIGISFEMSAWIAVLAAGQDALLSHRFAGKSYALEGTPPPVLFDISVPKTRDPRNVPRARIHRTTLRPEDVGVWHGMPITSLVRTVVDLARTLPLETGSQIVGDALRVGRVSAAAVERTLDALAGSTGIAQARRAFASADPKLESVLERELYALLRRAGLNPVRQYVVMAGGKFVARVDFALPGIRLAIQADGYTTHALRPGFERDREVAARLQLAGWYLLPFTATQIRQDPDWVVSTVLQMVRRLSAAGGTA
jgi:very-short-patch-repair endonuclease